MRRLALSHARVSALEEGLFARVLDAGEVVLSTAWTSVVNSVRSKQLSLLVSFSV